MQIWTAYYECSGTHNHGQLTFEATDLIDAGRAFWRFWQGRQTNDDACYGEPSHWGDLRAVKLLPFVCPRIGQDGNLLAPTLLVGAPYHLEWKFDTAGCSFAQKVERRRESLHQPERKS